MKQSNKKTARTSSPVDAGNSGHSAPNQASLEVLKPLVPTAPVEPSLNQERQPLSENELRYRRQEIERFLAKPKRSRRQQQMEAEADLQAIKASRQSDSRRF
jgi:hypothetical protein